MIIYALGIADEQLQSLIAAIVSFLLTFGGIILGSKFLPKDHGREFAVNGALSKGKARGAGLILILALIAASVICLPLNMEYFFRNAQRLFR